MAAENLTKPTILAAISAKEAELAEKLDLDRNAVIGGIFSGIAQARALNDGGGIIRGWVALGRFCGLNKPEAATDPVLSASSKAMEARFEMLSTAELMAIAEGRDFC